LPTNQSTAIVFDLLSEGEIELKEGIGSVFLNRVPIANSNVLQDAQSNYYTGTVNATGTTITTTHSLASGTKRGILIEKGYASSTTGNLSAGATTITTATSFFNEAAMRKDITEGWSGLDQKIRIVGAGPNGTDYEGYLVGYTSATQGSVLPAISTAVNGAVITFDHYSYATVGANNFTLDIACPRVSQSFRIWVGPVTNIISDDPSNTNWKFARVAFRPGTLNQSPIENIPGFTTASYGVTPGTEIKQYSSWFSANTGKLRMNKDTAVLPSGATGGPEVAVTSATLLAAGGGVATEIDEIMVTINATSLYSMRSSTQQKGGAGVSFQIIFEYNTTGSTTVYDSKRVIFGPTDTEVNAAPYWIWGGSNFAPNFNTSGNISGQYEKSTDFEFRFSIEEFKPFTNFRVVIRRVTPVNYTLDGIDYYNETSLKNVQAYINDKLSYPYSAYAAVMFDSEEFAGQFPERAYHCYGIRCEVPDNYITRRESNTGVAKYTRNSSTGADTGTYQVWTGNFRKVYCDNPVWVLRQLLIDNRFGLGNYIDASLINKWAAYAQARYCDEPVPDGFGGFEPRFTCAAYLTEPVEAYKLIKDFCTIMLAANYFLEGQLVIDGDRPKEPVYTFTKGNIVDGFFAYEGTGSKTRTNQIAVTFNDKNNFYEQEIELVDDIEGIISTGKIIQDSVQAFGASSRGQARRYGLWKLLSNKMQKEIVSFKTGENAGFIRPGDIVNIQDADRNLLRYSGRIASSTTTTVTIDKAIDLTAGFTYTLYALIDGAAAVVAESSATIGYTYLAKTAIQTGDPGSGFIIWNNATQTSSTEIRVSSFTDSTEDIGVFLASLTSGNKLIVQDRNNSSNYQQWQISGIPTVILNSYITIPVTLVSSAGTGTTGFADNAQLIFAKVYKAGDILSFISTEEAASNVTDISGNIVNVVWQPDMHLESRTVTTASGTGITTLTVSPAFSVAPQSEHIWGLVAKNSSGATLTGSAKPYKVFSISETGPGAYEIKAGEHYNLKFDLIDETFISDAPIYVTNYVSPVRNFLANIVYSSSNRESENSPAARQTDVNLSWDRPLVGADKDLKEYRITYYLFNKLEIITTTNTNYKISNIPEGSYEFTIQAVLTNNTTSTPTYTIVTVIGENDIAGKVTKLNLSKGGSFTVPLIISGANITTGGNAYTYIGASGSELNIVQAGSLILGRVYKILTLGQANFTGTISGTTLTVSAVSNGSITVGSLITGAGVTGNSIVTTFGTGTGTTGTYTLSQSSTVGTATAMISATPWTSVGAASNTIGVQFTATGAGAGLGTATEVR
jgi:hypothetical protein